MMDDGTFASIDRLVEFGLGMGVAQQMANAMNAALQNTTIPGPQTMAVAPSVRYHVMLDDRQAGPFAPHEIVQLIAAGRFTKDTHVWRPGMPRWETAENVPDVLRIVALAPPRGAVPPPFRPGGAA